MATVIIVAQLSTMSNIPGQRTLDQIQIKPEKSPLINGAIICSPEVNRVSNVPTPGIQDAPAIRAARLVKVAPNPSHPGQLLSRICRKRIRYFLYRNSDGSRASWVFYSFKDWIIFSEFARHPTSSFEVIHRHSV